MVEQSVETAVASGQHVPTEETSEASSSSEVAVKEVAVVEHEVASGGVQLPSVGVEVP